MAGVILCTYKILTFYIFDYLIEDVRKVINLLLLNVLQFYVQAYSILEKRDRDGI